MSTYTLSLDVNYVSHWDRPKRRMCINPIPCFGLMVELR